MVSEQERFRQACRLFDEIHQKDPKLVEVAGKEIPWSVFYHQCLSSWVEVLAGKPSLELQLAARCQHIRRWEIPRGKYPMNRQGYKRWRSDLGDFHADLAGRLLRRAGYAEETIERVSELLKKRKLKLDPEVQLLEDAICLVFLENEFPEFAARHEEEKLIRIIQRTWVKMSPRGHQAALILVENYPPELKKLMEKALAG